jgi:predicted glycogen debranching enzyme
MASEASPPARWPAPRPAAITACSWPRSSPPLGRTLLAAHVHETAAYDGQRQPLATSRWAGGTVAPDGYRHIESFRLEGTTPVWTYACGDALVEKRVWMEPGANTTYVRYVVLRARRPVGLALRVLVNYRDYHATTRAGNWRMDVTAVPHGVRVTAFGGARPFVVLVPGAEAHPVHDWFRDFDLAREAERGLDHLDDALHVVTFEAELARGASLTLVASTEAAPALAGEPAWQRRVQHEARVLQRWTAAPPEGAATPGWIAQLVLAADQFIVRRATPEDPDGLTVMAGYHWFGDWGRDTMIALPGLADHLGEHGVGSVAEIFDGDPPFRPAGCVAQAWSVAETLRAWHHLARGRGGMLQK